MKPRSTRAFFLFFLFLYLLPAGLAAQWHPYDEEEDPPVEDTLYHYWIKFPADVQAECEAELTIPGVETREYGKCDLLAVSQKDVVFPASSDGSCYKILRTYQVMNWCEYDGQAAPITVSRDWDGWNGTNPGRCSPLPDGNDKPGDRPIYVIVKREYNDTLPDTVWYDADPYPDNAHPDNPDTKLVEEGFWWNVTSGGDDPREEAYYEGGCSTWAYDRNQNDSDIRGNLAEDDDDYRYGSFGFWKYTQHIAVYDRIDPKLSISAVDTFYTTSNTDCSGIATFAISVSDSCGNADIRTVIQLDRFHDGTIDEDLTSDWQNGQLSGRFPEGTHRLRIEVYDGCGNEIIRNKVFYMVDGLAPAPVCTDGLIVELTGTDIDSLPAIASVWADDLVASDIYDCNGQDSDQTDTFGNPLVTAYSINRSGQAADRNQRGLDFSCDDLEAVRVPVELHAWDEVGNHDFCETHIEIQDNSGVCAPDSTMAMVAAVFTEEKQMMEGVELRISGDMEARVYTDKQGQYEMQAMKIGQQIHIEPYKTGEPMNGVTSADYNIIRRHILRAEPLTSAYKILAADADQNGVIDLRDLIAVQRMILGHEKEWPYQINWRFVAAEYQFPSPGNPWLEPFPESVDYLAGEESPYYSGSFYAVKTGDLNGSARTNKTAEQEPRSRQSFTIQLEPTMPDDKQVRDIAVYADELHRLDALQFGLSWDREKVEVLDISPGLIPKSALALFPDQGLLRSMWWRQGPLDKRERPLLFRIKVRKHQNTPEAALRLAPARLMPPEAYGLDRVARSVQIEISAPPPATAQVFPQPFTERAWITLPAGLQGTGTLRLFTGHGVQILQRPFEAGHATTIPLSAADLPGAGTYYYAIEVGNQRWQGKLIKVQ